MAIKIHGGNNPLVECINHTTDKWLVLWNMQEEEGSITYLGEVFEHKPSLAEIKDTVLDWYSKQVDQKILSGFTWNSIPVWLSIENQFNYKTAYDLAVKTNGQRLPTFKFGTVENPIYHKFESLEELEDFYIKFTTYVSETVAQGWAQKDGIDWKVYEDLLK